MRDMTGCGRYPPQPWHKPIQFYGCARLGNPELLKKIMETDPYFITQDNGAGSPLHFATTYKQLDMIHYLLSLGAEVNQRDDKGFTPLHRAAYLAQYDGYLEIYEYLLTRGADPSIRTENYDPYLSPGLKLAIEVAMDDEELRGKLKALDKKYAKVEKVRVPHPNIGCWWTLYDYGLEAVKKWPADYEHPFPEVLKRDKDDVIRKKLRAEKKARRAALEAAGVPVEPTTSDMPTIRGHLPPPSKKAAPAAPAAPVAPAKATPVAFLFPGQGSQAVGMLKSCKDIPAVKDMLATAQTVLGYDLLKLCLEGPKEKLDDTAFSQPALYVAGLAAVEKLRGEDAAAVEQCSAVAGLSLGEYCALVFAGALSFEDGLKVVQRRGESMSAAAKLGKAHGMLSVIGLDDKTMEEVCSKVRAAGGVDVVCQIANYLFPTGRVVSGHKSALDEVAKLATAAGAMKAVPLAVSGAFHTPLMQPAREALVEVLESVTFWEPRMAVYSNVTGKPFGSAAEIPAMLARQLVEPVRWEGTLAALVHEAKKDRLYELGPGVQIKAMVKRVDMGVWKAMKNITV